MIVTVPEWWLGAPPIEWVKALVPLGSAALQLAAAVLVARVGFNYGVRKTREERGFDRRIAWYDETLAAIRTTRESVQAAAGAESMWARNAAGSSTATPGGVTPQVREALWRDARSRTTELLRVLDQAVTRADVESEAAAASAHVKLRSMSAWMNTETTVTMPGADSTTSHPFTLSVLGTPSPVLKTFLEELHTVEQAAIAGARVGIGYKPRLPELVPNKGGVIEIPARDTVRTPFVRKMLRRIRLPHR